MTLLMITIIKRKGHWVARRGWRVGKGAQGTAGEGSGPEGGSLLLRTRFANDFCMHARGGEGQDRNATLQFF